MNKKFKVEEKVTTEVKVTEQQFEMKLGNMIKTDGIPQLEVCSINRKDKPHTFYLSPYRAYGFQISETIDGQWSAGESEFLGLKEIVLNNSERMAIGIMRAMIMDALYRHKKGYQVDWNEDIYQQQAINVFAEESYRWVKFLVDIDKTIKHEEQIAEQMKKSAEQWQKYHQEQQCTTEVFMEDCENVFSKLLKGKEGHELKQQQKRSNKKKMNVTIIEKLKNMVVKQA